MFSESKYASKSRENLGKSFGIYYEVYIQIISDNLNKKKNFSIISNCTILLGPNNQEKLSTNTTRYKQHSLRDLNYATIIMQHKRHFTIVTNSKGFKSPVP